MSDINIGLLAENQNLSEFEITDNFSCVRFLDQNKERFELEFNLEKGTSFNTFFIKSNEQLFIICLLYTSPSPRDRTRSRMPSSA